MKTGAMSFTDTYGVLEKVDLLLPGQSINVPVFNTKFNSIIAATCAVTQYVQRNGTCFGPGSGSDVLPPTYTHRTSEHECKTECDKLQGCVGYELAQTDDADVPTEGGEEGGAAQNSVPSDQRYIGCYANAGPNRTDNHEKVVPIISESKRFMTFDGCRQAASDAGKHYFGLENPRTPLFTHGVGSSINAECLLMQQLPSMTRVAANECSVKTDSCDRVMGGQYRLAVYATVAPDSGTTIVDHGRNGCFGRACEKCHGNCIVDNDCARDLRCFRRARVTDLVPGCAATGFAKASSDHDYCYDLKDLPLKMGQVGSAACPAGFERITTESFCRMAISRPVTNATYDHEQDW